MRTLAEDVDTLGRALGTVIREQEGEAFFELEERIRLGTKRARERSSAGREPSTDGDVAASLAEVSLPTAERLVRAFSCYFLLVNVAEEHERVRRVESAEGPRKQSLEQALIELKSEGHDATSARALIEALDLGLTFTAHPTEMRRRTVRGHLESINALLPRLGEGTAEAELAAHVEALWGTPRLRDRKPEVRDEVTAGLAYLDVIASVLPDLERDLERSFAKVFGEEARLHLPLSLHSWMGGDRDGNPNVTTAVTAETFARHADLAARGFERDLDLAYARLSQSRPDARSTDDEPFRKRLLEVRAALREGRPDALRARLSELETALVDARQLRVRDWFARPLVVRDCVFGTHLASLDIREHSKLVGGAIAELFRLSGGPGDYDQCPEAEKIARLTTELATRRPLKPVGARESEELERVLGPLRAAKDAVARVGPRAFGRYVVSMSEEVSDLLEVLVLGREVGIDLVPVPLFETLDDLARAPEVMKKTLALPCYRAALGDEVQEVMIGYSDSNKDAGFVAATWALYVAQDRVAEVCRDAGVRYRFFHGRGTSIGRGGGPMARGMLGQPPGTMSRGLRVTEQGEALGDRYSHPALARRNLEQAIYGLVASAGRKPRALDPAFSAALTEAAQASVTTYRALVHDRGFVPFFEGVTPLREIARLRISSRPVRRPSSEKASDAQAALAALRAIPWVMAWTQCRAIVPGWYGLDAALDALTRRDEKLAPRLYAEWPFFRSMVDNAQMALAKSDMAVFRAYRSLVTDDALGERIEAAYERTVAAVTRVTGATLLANEPRLLRSIELRNPYVEPIHRLQVELLRKVRAVATEEELPRELERALVLSLHGVAAGMRNTG